MRTAYSGRAAAYEKKGDYEKALADHKMIVLFYAIEAEILDNLKSPDRSKFLAESARAYRARGKCLELLGRTQEAARDRTKADGVEEVAKKLEDTSSQGNDKMAAAVLVLNYWTEPVIFVVDGASHRLEIGRPKDNSCARQASSPRMRCRRASTGGLGTLEAGKKYTIRPTPSGH